MLVLGLPIVDTVLAMVRRLLGSFQPEQKKNGSLLNKLRSMFVPDRKHIHHQLLTLGLSHRNAVLMLYVVSFVFGVVAFATTLTQTNGATLLLLGGVGIAILEGVRRLRYREMSILRNGMLLPIYKSAIVNKGIFQSVLDLGFIAFAFSTAFYLTLAQTGGAGHRAVFFLSLLLVCGIQVCVFYFMGLYRGTFHGLGIGDLLKIVRAVTLSTVITAVVLVTSFKIYSFVLPPVFILDFFILLSLIAGSRLSFRVLTYLFRKEMGTGKRALIYGSDLSGVVTLQHILNDDRFNHQLVGFVVDDPALEGKRLNGYKVFGGHWKLPGLLKKHQIDEVFISTDRIHAVVLDRLKQAADAQGVVLRRPKVLVENITLRPYKQSRTPEIKKITVHQEQPAPAIEKVRHDAAIPQSVLSSRHNGD
jgi:UDP-GlcNAc:undecaprenyl-phosphate GlcNAc-1-phosphate transferase